MLLRDGNGVLRILRQDRKEPCKSARKKKIEEAEVEGNPNGDAGNEHRVHDSLHAGRPCHVAQFAARILQILCESIGHMLSFENRLAAVSNTLPNQVAERKKRTARRAIAVRAQP